MTTQMSDDMIKALHRAVFLHDGNIGLCATTRTIRALARRGYVDGIMVTEAGRLALDAYHREGRR
jgi:hypothetical protein